MSAETTVQRAYPNDWPPVLLGRFLLQQAERLPDYVAVVSHGSSYTYAELAAAAESYRMTLRDAGLRHGDPVAVQMEPSFEALAVLLACSETGCVYVPFNTDLPSARVLEICAKLDARTYVVGPGTADPLPSAAGELPLLGIARQGELLIYGDELAPHGLDRRVLESNTAYVIFTSGSTGTPKGVMMSHRAVVVAFRAIADACDSHRRLASIAPLGFDLNLLDTAAALGRGQTVVYVPRNVSLHPRLLLDHLVQQQVEQLHCVPALWSLLLRHCGDRLRELSSLKRTVVGGEELTILLVEAARKALPGLDVINLYGQTETICCTFFRVPDPVPDAWQSIPLGTAYPGAELILVDEQNRQVDADGVVGELYLRSAAMFEGYWGDDQLTAQVLVPDPCVPVARECWLRTGDLAVRRPSGLSFVGRRDHQVQIYGNRVELGEIERCLSEVGGVDSVGVAAVRRGDEHLLVAVVVLAEGQLPSSTAGGLRARCRARLPKYMVPARFMFTGELPLSQSGKIDRKALTVLAEQHLAETEAPESARDTL